MAVDVVLVVVKRVVDDEEVDRLDDTLEDEDEDVDVDLV